MQPHAALTDLELNDWRLPVAIEVPISEEYHVLRQDAVRLNESRYYDFRPVRQISDVTRATVLPSNG